jgi:excinuclease ABC subunit A
VDEVADRILALDEGTRVQVFFPLQPPPKPLEPEKPKGRRVAKKKKAKAPADDAQLKERLFELRKRGYNRLYQNGRVVEFSTPESLLDLDFAEPVSVLIDRISVSPDARLRIVDAVEQGYREAGEVLFETVSREGEAQQQLRFSQRFECKQCNIRYEEPEPRLFSFNNPFGACPRCQGFGNTIDFDLNLVIPNKTLTLAEGAIEPWTKPKYKPLATEMRRFARVEGIPLDVSWQDLSADQQSFIVNGEGKFWGVRGFFEHLERKKYKLHVRVFLSRYRGYSTCSDCCGLRLRREARQVKVSGKDICQVSAMTVEEATRFFSQLELSRQEGDIAGRLLEEINDRLRYLNDVGLEYLTLDRLASTLSGGEAQRIQLATSLGSRLVGTLYVLDEPSIGLHSRDTERLIKILHDLRDLGNTILVVEHDAEIMRSADRIIDLGPGAGENGGKLIAVGTYDEILHNPSSLTGRYLSGELRIQFPTARRTGTGRKIKLIGARAHNLKKVSVAIPLGMLVCITGVSGSGKSTLVHDVLYNALAAEKQQVTGGPSAEVERVEGAEWIDEVVLVDQSPIGRTPRSNPVTYIKAFDAIRELFAALPESEKRGYAAGHFSFNIPGGRCDVCQGDGTVTVEMQFLADVELICEECKGTRYKPEILEIRYHGKNIHDVLEMTVKEALHFFSGVPKIVEKLRVLEEVGLGYLRLGQSATTLSGGEAQRMKLAAHLQPRLRDIGKPRSEQNKRQPRMLYIFDEPTTGLHFDDVSKLLAAFRRLIEAGGSIVVIEHNLDVIKTADWVIDLGPEGGARGGHVVAEGPPEVIVGAPNSYTGQWLARVLPVPAHSDGG